MLLIPPTYEILVLPTGDSSLCVQVPKFATLHYELMANHVSSNRQSGPDRRLCDWNSVHVGGAHREEVMKKAT